MLSRFNKKEGFTLIELMIVVAIIGILAVIAVPNFLTMQLRAKRSEVPLNLSGVATAEQAYFHEFGEYIAATEYPAAPGKTKKQAWTPAATHGFPLLGWSPDGQVYGTYAVAVDNSAAPVFTADGTCDVDGDGTEAAYRATQASKPIQTNANNIY